MNEPILLHRYAVDLKTDGRTLTGRAVPYNTAADVTDLLPDGTHDTYREGFRPTAFTHQLKEPHRVRLIDGHAEENHDARLGVAAAMRSTGDGLEIDFRLLDDMAAQRAATLLEVGVKDLSVGFSPLRGGTSIDDDGTRWRTRALLRHVALEADGAYPGAEVLALRQDDNDLAKADAEYERVIAELADFTASSRARQDELLGLLARRRGTPQP